MSGEGEADGQGKAWKLIGIIKPEDKPYGFVTAVDGERS